MMDSTCVVTGGAGFIGCATSKSLVEKFAKVIAIDNLHPQIHADSVRPNALDPGVELVVGDVAVDATWDVLLTQHYPEVILQLAAETGTGQSLFNASRHAGANVLGTTCMLDALVRHQRIPKRIVLASSRAVYGEGAWMDKTSGEISYPGQRSKAQLERCEWDFPELICQPSEAGTTQPWPTSVYGATKLAQEHIMSAWGLSFDVEVVTLRLQNVYGPGQSLSNSYTGIVPLFARMARDGKSIPVYEDGNIVRDFVFIEDVAKVICRAVTQNLRSRTPYDIGTGEKTALIELATMIATLYNAPPPHITGAFRNGDVRHAVCKISRARDELGWFPLVRLAQGIEMLCTWIDCQLGARKH
jgi:dTDP-L-rhamnose 4-epimerase